MTEKRRLMIAERIMEKYPNSCWGMLVMWAVFPENHYPGRLRECVEMGGKWCKVDRGGCYCGKYGGNND